MAEFPRHPAWAALKSLDRGIEQMEKLVLAGSVLLMAGVNIANVFGRNFLGQTLASAEELNQILMVLITFMGIGYGVRHARHIRMSALHEQLPGPWRKGLHMVICAGTALLLAALAYHATRYVGEVRTLGSVTPALQIPLYLIYLWVPVGLGLGVLQYGLALLGNLMAPGTYLSLHRTEGCEPPEGGA